ncbi:MAG TPA: dolichyl-phosphate beta-glucosyltransferase [Dehalococcoidia bacterium]|nr:dolichyl-phosphate beta-glucosyltransferase [Dehalococcoidia bacterium]
MPSVDVVVPVYNEETDLPKNIPILHRFLSSDAFPYQWRIIIADNASTDETPAVSQKLSQELSNVAYTRIPQKGRGRALKATWGQSQADIVSYMDVDLSTDLQAFPPLVKAVAEGGYDLATGSRLARGARTKRSLQREVLSRGYVFLIRLLFWTSLSDAQCGFKAARREAAQKLLPLIKDNNWFWDTEMLLLAQKLGMRVAEIPVRWQEDPNSTVQIRKTVLEDLRGLWRLRIEQPWRKK